MKRITKKPFGIYVSPGNSPVEPEKFSGFHTGVDFETTAEEQNSSVAVYSICDGPLLEKRTASGYGGVAVQSCRLEDQDVTVVYGHIKLSSINIISGQQVQAGQQIAVLGSPYSAETDGERKHLHLGIRIGNTTNIAGYTGKEEQLSGWLDAASYLQ
jgi:murein DD-endopeptidase MepM/ murein hydrolase activator NlpD